MTNVLPFPPRFDLLNFETYKPMDLEEGLAVVLDSDYQPQNEALLALRSDREIRGDFLTFITLRDIESIGG